MVGPSETAHHDDATPRQLYDGGVGEQKRNQVSVLVDLFGTLMEMLMGLRGIDVFKPISFVKNFVCKIFVN